MARREEGRVERGKGERGEEEQGRKEGIGKREEARVGRGGVGGLRLACSMEGCTGERASWRGKWCGGTDGA